jgi:type IV fimbrial biogenesis protein FimT
MYRILTRTRRQSAQRRAQVGITLVETTVVTSVLAVLTGLAVPSFDSSMQRRHLEGAAAQLETDVHYARSLAVARNAPLRISFEAGAGGSC